MPLPDIPDSDYNEWQAAKFASVASKRVASIGRPPAYIDSSSHQAFINGLLPLAQEWEGRTGIDAGTWLAMAASESNWGKAGTALFGIKGSGNAGSLNSPTWESVNGQRVNQNDNFATYKTAEDAFQGFWDLMQNPRYSSALKVLQNGGNGDAFVHEINRAGYATDPNWASSVRSIANTSIAPLVAQAPPMGAQAPYPQGLNTTLGTGANAPAVSPSPPPQTPPAGATGFSPLSAVANAVRPLTDAVQEVPFEQFAQNLMSKLGASPTPSGGGALPQQSATLSDLSATPDQQDFGSYATSKIASLGYNDMAGVDTNPAPAFGANPPGVTSPIDQARDAQAATQPMPYNDMAGASSSPVTTEPSFGEQALKTLGDVSSVPAQLTRSALVGPAEPQGPILDAIGRATGPVGQGVINQARNVYRGVQQSDPNVPILPRVEQVLTNASQPFEQTVTDTQAAIRPYDPTGGLVTGAVGLGAHLASDPLMYVAPVSKAMTVGTVGGALAGYGVSRYQGASPEQTAANVETGGNLGMLAGGAGEGLYHLGKAVAPYVPGAIDAAGRGLTQLGEIGTERGLVPGATLRPESGTVAYHGTGSTFDRPNPAMFNQKDAVLGPAYYVSLDPETANHWAISGRLMGGDAQVRKVIIPSDVSILDASQKLSPEQVNPIISALNRVNPEAASVLQNRIDNLAPGRALTTDSIYSWLRDNYLDGKGTNDVFAAAGYDGISDARHILLDSPLDKDQIAIFEQSLGKLTNAISGTRFGSSPTVGGALVGGYAGSQQGDTPEERARNAVLGAAGGALVGGALAHPRVQGEIGRLVGDESGMAGRVPMPPPPPIPPPVPGDPLQTIHNMYTDIPKDPGLPPAEIMRRSGDAFVRSWTDRGIDLKHFQQDTAKDIGRALKPDEMAYELARLNPDKAAEVRIQEGIRPALLQVGEQDQIHLSDYLTAKHNIDVAKAMGQKVQGEALKEPLPKLSAEQRVKSINSQITMYQRLRADGVAAGDGTAVTHYDQLLSEAKTNLGRAQKLALRQVTAADAQRAAGAQVAGKEAEAARKFSGGINVAESKQALVDLATKVGPDRFRNIEDAATKVSGFVDSLRNRAVESGLWDAELAAGLKKQYPNFAPTKILDYMQEPGNIPNGKSLSVRDQGLKSLTVEGTQRLREDPISSLVRASYQMEGLARKNEAFNAFVKLNNLRAPADRIIKEVPDSYTAMANERKIQGFINGKRVTYVAPKEYDTIIKQEANTPIRWVGPAMGMYKSLLTSKNPSFVAGQIPLDAMTYIIRESVRGGGPQVLPKVLTELFKAYGDAFQGITTRTYHGNAAEFLKGGGGMGGFFQGEPGQVRKTVSDLARPNAITVNSPSDVRRIIRDLLTLKPIEAFGERAELAPRMASMKLAEARGQNRVQRVIAGRDVTTDFQMGGTSAKFLNQGIPFFNVGMQGLSTIPRTIRDNPKGALLTYLPLAATVIGYEAWNRSDPQRAKDYEDIPQYIKDRSLVFMLPLPASVNSQGERHPQYVEFRMREYAPLVDLTRGVMQKVLGDDTRSWGSLIAGAVNASSPIQTDSALGLFGSLVPPGISTGLDLANNRDSYRGATIATKGADERASALSTAMANGIYGATGVNARPSQVEFASRDLTGGVGQIARDVSNMVAQKPSGGTPQDTPILGQVTRRFVGGSIGQRLQSAQDQTMSPEVEGILREAGIYSIAPVQDTINGLPLSRDEQAIYQQTTNAAIGRLLPRVAQSPAYQRLSPPDKADLLRSMMDDMRQMAADITMGQVDPAGLKDRVGRQLATEAAARAGAGR